MRDPLASLRRALNRARHVAALDGACLYWWDADALALCFLAGTDGDFAGLCPIIRAGQDVAGRAFEQGAPVAVDDYQAWPYKTSWRQRQGIASAAAVPVVGGQQPIGVLCVYGYSVGSISAAVIARLQDLCASIAPLLPRLEVYARAERRRVEMEVLADLMRRGADEAGLSETVIALVTEYSGLLLGADYAAVALAAKDGTVSWHGLWGLRAGTPPASRLPSGEGIIGRVLATGHTLVIDHLGDNPAYPPDEFPVHSAEGGRTIIATPLTTRGSLVGALVLGWRFDLMVPPAHIRLAETLAAFAASIIDNARIRAGLRVAEDYIRTIYNALSCGVVVLNSAGEIIDANETARRLMSDGYVLSRDSLPLTALVHAIYGNDEPMAEAERPSRRALASGEAQRGVPVGIVLPDGRERWLQIDAVPIKDPQGVVQQVVVSFVDITERKRVEEALHKSERRLQTVVSNAPVILFALDRHGMFTFGEGRGLEALETKPDTWSGRLVAEVFGHVPEFMDYTQRALAGETLTGIVEIAGLVFETRYVPLRDDDGTVSGVIGVSTDITERRRAEELLRYQALHDLLTGLPNRTLLHDRLQYALLAALRDGHTLALLLLDLDRFKEVNDTFGHQQGDLLLQQVAKQLHDNLRAVDTVARLGGDEFAIILAKSTCAGALQTARKIGRILDMPVTVDGQAIHIGASIGIALAPEHGRDPDVLLRCADVAMYVAKRTGRGCAVYEPAHDHHSPERLELIADLRQAIERGALTLHYQPKIAIATGRPQGVEVLARWPHPTHGMILPAQFVALAEQTGLIVPLTRWVLEEALRQCRDWQRAGVDVLMQVNLSSTNLRDVRLADMVIGLLRQYGIAPDSLCLELTENTIMSDAEQSLDVLRRLGSAGIGVSIDDFGTGYSSLAYLKRLPVGEIKIDKSFVMHMIEDETDVSIVASTIGLGHNLGLRVVAEGVENKETLDLLASLHCDIAQGYYLGRPVPASDLTPWLSRKLWE